MSYSNTSTGNQPADPYKDKNIQEPGAQEKCDALANFAQKSKFCMLVTHLPSTGLLVSRAMAVAAREGNGIDMMFHANTESGKTDDLQKDPKVNLAFLNSSGEWASISGEATVFTDRETIHKHYSQALKAWMGDLGDGKHDGGPDDPRICMIRVKAQTAQYAISDKTMIGSVVEVAKGVATGEAPAVHKLRYIDEQELAQFRSI